MNKPCISFLCGHLFFILLAGPGQKKVPKIWSIAQSHIPWFNIFKIPVSQPAASITNSAVCALNQSSACHISPHWVQLDLLLQIHVRENGYKGLLCVLLIGAILVWSSHCDVTSVLSMARSWQRFSHLYEHLSSPILKFPMSLKCSPSSSNSHVYHNHNLSIYYYSQVLTTGIVFSIAYGLPTYMITLTHVVLE